MTDMNECRYKSYVFIALAAIEAAVIAILIASKTTVIIQPDETPSTVQSPLELALDYESPDEKFEELVKANRGWIPYRPPLSDFTILADCAILKKTNHIRILVAHGADVKDAINSLEAAGMRDAAELIRAVAKASDRK